MNENEALVREVQTLRKRTPTQEEGEAEANRLAAIGWMKHGEVSVGGHHGRLCKCGTWVWDGHTVCRRCVDSAEINRLKLEANTQRKAKAAWESQARRLEADIEAESQALVALIKRFGAMAGEPIWAFLERLEKASIAAPVEVNEYNVEWRSVTNDTAFAPPFGTIRQCRGCGCLVAGGPTACVRCDERGQVKP